MVFLSSCCKIQCHGNVCKDPLFHHTSWHNGLISVRNGCVVKVSTKSLVLFWLNPLRDCLVFVGDSKVFGKLMHFIAKRGNQRSSELEDRQILEALNIPAESQDQELSSPQLNYL